MPLHKIELKRGKHLVRLQNKIFTCVTLAQLIDYFLHDEEANQQYKKM